ncbi:MAG: 3-oxoacid CoA-transferase subunit B [Myxococcota bacterium]|jgi:3-oxoacid CoA-transferase subunit B
MSWSREDIARQALAEITPWSVVNLGIGLPTLVGDLLPEDAPVWLQSENGILGMGPFPEDGQEDAQLINAGKQTVTVRAGGALFDSATSFAMIRGGHVDLALLGALQVSAGGDLANWSVPGGRTMGIGGAMDLAAGAGRVVVLTRHTARDGASKLLAGCTYPLTAVGVVGRVITDLGIFDPLGEGFAVIRLAPGVTLTDAVAATDAPLIDRRPTSESAP